MAETFTDESGTWERRGLAAVLVEPSQAWLDQEPLPPPPVSEAADAVRSAAASVRQQAAALSASGATRKSFEAAAAGLEAVADAIGGGS